MRLNSEFLPLDISPQNRLNQTDTYQTNKHTGCQADFAPTLEHIFGNTSKHICILLCAEFNCGFKGINHKVVLDWFGFYLSYSRPCF